MSDVAPNDPSIAEQLVNELRDSITEFGGIVTAWQERVDSIVVRLQNAATSEQLPDGGYSGQTPAGYGTPSDVPDDDDSASSEPVDDSEPVDFSGDTVDDESDEFPTEPTESSTDDLGEPPADTTRYP